MRICAGIECGCPLCVCRCSGAFVLLVQRAVQAVQRLQGNVQPLLLPPALHLLLFLCKRLLFSTQYLCSACTGAVCTLTSGSSPLPSHLQGIVSLCLQFERLLQAHLPQLFYHLRQIGAQPWVHAAAAAAAAATAASARRSISTGVATSWKCNSTTVTTAKSVTNSQISRSDSSVDFHKVRHTPPLGVLEDIFTQTFKQVMQI